MALKNSIDQLIRSEWNKHSYKQLTLWDALESSSQKNVSCVSSNSDTHETTHETTGWVQEYTVTARGEKYKYYRFCYLKELGNIGSCVRVHISGGDIHNPKAIVLKQKVVWAIAQKLSPTQIVEIINSSTPARLGATIPASRH